MGYYFVDYENVKIDGLNGINKLEPSDKVCIFYSEHADTLTFDLHKRLNESKATITFQKVEVGHKNALDFQLVTFLGYEIASKKEEKVSSEAQTTFSRRQFQQNCFTASKIAKIQPKIQNARRFRFPRENREIHCDCILNIAFRKQIGGFTCEKSGAKSF